MKVYTKTGCPWCVSAINWLKSAGYDFEEIDVRQDPAKFEEMQQLSGQTKSPTMEVDGKVLADFDVDELQVFLKQHNITP